MLRRPKVVLAATPLRPFAGKQDAVSATGATMGEAPPEIPPGPIGPIQAAMAQSPGGSIIIDCAACPLGAARRPRGRRK